MRRVYNHRISERANESLRKRERTVAVHKQMMALSAILVIAVAILLGSSIRAFAGAKVRPALHKYYTSIRVEQGDTLWTLADDYVIDHVMDREEFVDEVSRLNGLSDGEIRSGEDLVIVYYSTEEK